MNSPAQRNCFGPQGLRSQKKKKPTKIVERTRIPSRVRIAIRYTFKATTAERNHMALRDLPNPPFVTRFCSHRGSSLVGGGTFGKVPNLVA